MAPPATTTTTTATEAAAVVVSAPGKVLLSGGYLVLDRSHRALVFGLDARIHVHVVDGEQEREQEQEQERERGNGSQDLARCGVVWVRSPQFKDAEWVYRFARNAAAAGSGGVRGGNGDGDSVEMVAVPASTGQKMSTNSFVQITLQYVFTYLVQLYLKLPHGVIITILADDDYYSHSQNRVSGKFTHFGVTIQDAHKTGLGSSAALVTALTAALITKYLPSTVPSGVSSQYKVIHNLAQAAHSAAQGKVGSGFDVAAAVFGSCLYRRFTPSILEWVGEASSPSFGPRLHRCVDDLDPTHKWDIEVLKHDVHVPKSLRLVMCDIDCGSQTPGMVKKVLLWRKQKPEEANLLWEALQKGTNDLCSELKRLSELEGILAEDYHSLKEVISTIRSLIREMSEKSGVPIEPKVQTELLDGCSQLPGVIGGVVPGAGGYDAIALLIRNEDSAIEQLKAYLKKWTSVTDSDSGMKIGRVNLLDVKQEFEGLRLEDPARYGGWI